MTILFPKDLRSIWTEKYRVNKYSLHNKIEKCVNHICLTAATKYCPDETEYTHSSHSSQGRAVTLVDVYGAIVEQIAVPEHEEASQLQLGG
jgi:hypothetical protein